MDATLATDVLQEALAQYPIPKIFNSDQGSQYTSYEHTQLLKDHGIEISMNGKGRSIDNIAIERFFRTLKYGNIYINDYQTTKQLKELKTISINITSSDSIHLLIIKNR